MTRYAILSIIILILVTSCRNESSNISRQPNIVILFIDDMGYADLSCYGNQLIRTPNIDKLAENGLTYTNFYVNSPICSPSRVALHTGNYPIRYRIHSYIASSKANNRRDMADFLDPESSTIAKTLKKNGYKTGHFGKWHMGGGRDLGDVPYPSEYGFDETLVGFEGIGNRVLTPGHGLSNASSKLGKGKIVWTEKFNTTHVYIDSALSFISKCSNAPFYVNLFPNDVHDPHQPDSLSVIKFKNITKNPYEQKFLAVLDELDHQIGRFMHGLDSMGKLDNTIVIFTSDNGPTDWPSYYDINEYPENYDARTYPPGSTGPYFGRKWSLYEGGIRMPFIISWPGHIEPGNTDQQTVMSAIDIYPSLCSLLGINYPDNLDGEDLSNSFFGTAKERNNPVFWEYGSCKGGSIEPGNEDFISPNLAIREGRWKLLIDADSTNAQLYDLINDPGERENISGSNPDIARDMANKILKWRRSMPVMIGEKRDQ